MSANDHSFIKAERIVRTVLALLEREVVLPQMVWRDAGGDFAGAKDDTISIRLPAYSNSKTRTLRSATGYTLSDLAERKVDVTLDTDVYNGAPVTDEQLTLDIESFGEQVLVPIVRSVARGVEDALATEISGATYENTVEIGASTFNSLIDARTFLNKANVPFDGRALIVGSDVEAAILKDEHLNKFEQSGDSSAFRDATIGRIAGFTAVTVPALAPDEAYAFHRTAYVLSSRAPVVPDGVPFGASESFAGLAMRVIRDYDFTNIRDRLLVNTYIGTDIVPDNGAYDADEKFVPSEDPEASGEADLFVRAVKLTLPAS